MREISKIILFHLHAASHIQQGKQWGPSVTTLGYLSILPFCLNSRHCVANGGAQRNTI